MWWRCFSPEAKISKTLIELIMWDFGQAQKLKCAKSELILLKRKSIITYWSCGIECVK